MHRSARTAQTTRPSLSFSSTMQPATGQAAWQIEHAKAPKHRSGSITAMVLGAFFRGPPIILVHIVRRLYPGRFYLSATTPSTERSGSDPDLAAFSREPLFSLG